MKKLVTWLAAFALAVIAARGIVAAETAVALAPRPVVINTPLGGSNFKWDSVDGVAAAALPNFRLYGKLDNLRVEHPDYGHDFPETMRQLAFREFGEGLK